MLRRSLILVAFAATTITVLDVGSAMAIPPFRPPVRSAVQRLPHPATAAEPVRRAVPHDGVPDPERRPTGGPGRESERGWADQDADRQPRPPDRRRAVRVHGITARN